MTHTFDKMALMTKKNHIQIRISDEEKNLLRAKATKEGFDSMSAYILFIIRKEFKKP